MGTLQRGPLLGRASCGGEVGAAGSPSPAGLRSDPFARTGLPLSSPPFSTPFLCRDGRVCEGLHGSLIDCPCAGACDHAYTFSLNTFTYMRGPPSAFLHQTKKCGSKWVEPLPRWVNYFIFPAKKKKSTFLPGCVCPALANGSVVTWGGGLEAARLTGHGLCLPTQLLSPHRAGPHAGTGAFCALTLTLTGGRCCLHRDTKHLMDQTCPILRDEGSSLRPSPTANKNGLSYMFLCRLCSAVTLPGGAKETRSQGRSWDGKAPIPALSPDRSTCCLRSASALFISRCTPAFAQGEKDHANDLPQGISGSCLSQRTLPSPQLCHATQDAHEFPLP